jgi:hypothetical protein
MTVDWYSSTDVFAAGVLLETDHSETLALIDAISQGGDALATLLGNVLSKFSPPIRIAITEAVRGLFTTQVQRIRDADNGNGVHIVMPWQWILTGFFWFFEIRTRVRFSSQEEWRWCHKCQGLFYSGDQELVGTCPAGGQHEKGVSGNYALTHNEPNAPGQQDWRWCHKCQGLFYSGGQELVGTCPAGGQHERSVSGNYTLAHNEPNAPGQQDWRWCHKCQGLFYSGGQVSVGACPAGGQHEKGVSGMYTLGHTPAG